MFFVALNLNLSIYGNNVMGLERIQGGRGEVYEQI